MMDAYVPESPQLVVDPEWDGVAPTLRPEGQLVFAGEMYHQDELRRAMDAAGAPGIVVAQLLRDRENPHHQGAVAVFIGADHVGYVGREDLALNGQALYRALARLAETGLPATCWARFYRRGSTASLILLTGGEYESGKLDEPYPFPVTIPPGGKAPVQGGEGQQERLSRLVGRKSEFVAGAKLTIAEVDPLRPKAGGPVLMVSIDGAEIGAVSAKRSVGRIPLVRHLETRNVEARALSWIRPSSGAHGGLVCSISTCEMETTAEDARAEKQGDSTGAAPQSPPSGWYADPRGRFELRYWDGSAWTEHVATKGAESVDAV